MLLYLQCHAQSSREVPSSLLDAQPVRCLSGIFPLHKSVYKKTPALQKDESLMISRYHLMFIDSSHCPPLRVRPCGLYSSTLTDAGTVAAYYPQSCGIWCEAQRCIHTKLPMRLSSTGCFLYVSLYATSSYHCFS